MSEEKIGYLDIKTFEELTNHYIGLKAKISELEKNFGSENVAMVEFRKELNEQEKTYQELRNRILNIKPNNELFIKCMRMQQQIDELKEQMTNNYEYFKTVNHNQFIDREVLRELNDAFNKLVDKLTPEEYSEEQDWWSDLYGSVNIDKLEGDSKDIVIGVDVYPTEMTGRLIKGGEKSVTTIGELGGHLGEIPHDPLTDSKPSIFDTTICERCCYEYTKGDYCYKHHQQFNFGHQIINCDDFEAKEKPPEQDFPPLITKDTETTVTITYDFDRFKLVPKEALERIFKRLEHFLDVYHRGSFPYPSTYIDWDNELRNDKKRYLDI